RLRPSVRQNMCHGCPEIQNDSGRIFGSLGLKDLCLSKKSLDRLLHSSQGSAAREARGRRTAEIQLAIPGRTTLVAKKQSDEQLWPLGREIKGQLCVVEIEQARAETSRLAVDHVEDLHFFT